jgi:hypothetical protein
MPTVAHSDTSVSKVSLTVMAGAVRVPTSGALYKISSDQRNHVADIAPDGKVSRSVSCTDGDQFEAEADSFLVRPIAPVRRPCDQTMAFSFKRAVLVSWDKAGSSPLLDPTTGPTVYSNYAAIFAEKGQTSAFSAWSDAAVASTAIEALGDKKLDMFVMRDPKQDYRLVLSAKGVAALKQKQKGWGIEPTGHLDFATQMAIAKPPSSAASSVRMVYALKCVMRENAVLCASPDASSVAPEFEGISKYPAVANLPALPLTLSK